MGQTVKINDVSAIGDVLVIDTDRSFTGQDGAVVRPGDSGGGVPALLAASLFALNLGIDHLHVQQNLVTVRRPGGWDQQQTELVTDATTSFLRFYDSEEE